jgi:NTE family protein
MTSTRSRLNPIRRALLGAAALQLAGCASTPAPPVPASAPAPQPPPVRPRVALALGGGAARGFAHVGVIEVLEQAGLKPDVVVGTSAGSLVGALYASGMPVTALRQAAMSLDEGALGDWTLGARGVLKGKALQDMVNRLVANKPIERFPIPFAAVACDLYTGRPLLIRKGEAGLAVRASSAVPGVFEPVSISGRDYVDGGVVSPVPVRAARELGGGYVIAVDISAKPRFQSTDTLPQVVLQTFTIMSQQLAAQELRDADIVLAPAVGDLGSGDFRQRQRAIDEGRRSAFAALPALREAIGVPSARPS